MMKIAALAAVATAVTFSAATASACPQHTSHAKAKRATSWSHSPAGYQYTGSYDYAPQQQPQQYYQTSPGMTSWNQSPAGYHYTGSYGYGYAPLYQQQTYSPNVGWDAYRGSINTSPSSWSSSTLEYW